MRLDFKLQGLDRVRHTYKGLKRNVPRGMSKAVARITLYLQGQAKLQLTEGKNRAIDTGYLRSSVSAQINRNNAVIWPNAYYGVFIHEGANSMRARPFLEDAVDENVREVENILFEQIKKSTGL